MLKRIGVFTVMMSIGCLLLSGGVVSVFADAPDAVILASDDNFGNVDENAEGSVTEPDAQDTHPIDEPQQEPEYDPVQDDSMDSEDDDVEVPEE